MSPLINSLGAVTAGIIGVIFAVAALLVGILGLFLVRRQRILRVGEAAALRAEMDAMQRECLAQTHAIAGALAESEKNAQASLELLRDGRLGMPARARALRMLRSGMAAETAAAELGLARNEVQLLGKIAVLLAPRN